ncbi:MAG: M48 family metallopeptidase [Butyrivibrio sp.]|nr:M48 family metallopeptidase [Butyrivibrio sp.]
MQQDINASDKKSDSGNVENKFTASELANILIDAKIKLPRLVSHYAKEMDIEYENVFIKAQKTRWGSCSDRGNINLNCLLTQVPPYVRRYVIVHELAHRKEMNHSERFWKIVADEMPDYQKSVRWLKKHGDSIIDRL